MPTENFVCGHEFIGIIEELGADVKNFERGQEVVVPFFTACGTCFHCIRRESSRCVEGKGFGFGTGLDGGQAEYVRVPTADSTCVLAPQNVRREMLVLMGDVFPTGYFAASRFLSGLRPDEARSTVSVVIGCGPVGCCAIASAKHLARGGTVFAIDMIEERLQEAAKLGAIPLNLNLGQEALVQKIKDASDGRGADVVMEVVGMSDAVALGLQLVRPFGKLSSVGVHYKEIALQGVDLYGKNATLAFGRCPVRSIFEESLAVLEAVQDDLVFLLGHKMKLNDAPEAFRLFEQRKVRQISPVSESVARAEQAIGSQDHFRHGAIGVPNEWESSRETINTCREHYLG